MGAHGRTRACAASAPPAGRLLIQLRTLIQLKTLIQLTTLTQLTTLATKLKQPLKNADELLIATDEDRDGEAIAVGQAQPARLSSARRARGQTRNIDKDARQWRDSPAKRRP